MKKVITCDREWLEKPETKQMLGEEIVNEMLKKADREDKLVKTLLEAVIKNAEAGIHNGVLDKRPGYVEDQYSNLETALALLVDYESQDNSEFNFGLLGEVLTDSADKNSSVEGAISTMLDYLEGVNKTKFDFSDDEINELVKLIEE